MVRSLLDEGEDYVWSVSRISRRVLCQSYFNQQSVCHWVNSLILLEWTVRRWGSLSWGFLLIICTVQLTRQWRGGNGRKYSGMIDDFSKKCVQEWFTKKQQQQKITPCVHTPLWGSEPNGLTFRHIPGAAGPPQHTFHKATEHHSIIPTLSSLTHTAYLVVCSTMHESIRIHGFHLCDVILMHYIYVPMCLLPWFRACRCIAICSLLCFPFATKCVDPGYL